MSKRTSYWTLALAVVASLAMTQGTYAQQTGTGGAPGSTQPGAAIPDRGGENDLPIGNPQQGAEIADPPKDPVEDGDNPPKIYDEEIPTKTDSIIYVIDISGSMDWDDHTYTDSDGTQRSGPRIDRAKAELRKSIIALPPDFEFNVFAFDCGMRRWSASKQKAEPGPKASAISWVTHLQCGDATGTGPAVAAALGDKANFTVVLLSDGAPNCPFYSDEIRQTLNMIVSADTQGAVIHCFGIACYGEFEQFMRDVASRTGGRYYGVP
ncbi:MAG TPA: hypothetical protein VHF22_10625 [Planctomycetota bacterium]|nr:hypothetical protein [Planctomycetota bacterium]